MSEPIKDDKGNTVGIHFGFDEIDEFTDFLRKEYATDEPEAGR